MSSPDKQNAKPSDKNWFMFIADNCVHIGVLEYDSSSALAYFILPAPVEEGGPLVKTTAETATTHSSENSKLTPRSNPFLFTISSDPL